MTYNPKHAVYAFGKFSSAYYALAIGAGDIKQRLLASSDIFWAVSPEMLPPGIRPHFVWIKDQLMRFPSVNNEGEVKATIHRIHRSTCVEIAKRVILVSSLLEEYISSKST